MAYFSYFLVELMPGVTFLVWIGRGSDRSVCWTVIDNCKLQWKQDCSDNIFDHLKEDKVFEEGKLEMTAAS